MIDQPIPFVEYSIVRISKIIAPNRSNYGIPKVITEPQVGDIGAIVNVDSETGNWGPVYSVESVNQKGKTIWLSTLHHEELELVQAPPFN